MKNFLIPCCIALCLAAIPGCSSHTNSTAKDEHAPPTTAQLEVYECGTITRLHTFDGIFLASQPKPEDIEQAAQSGVRTVINLRHESEIKDFNEPQFVAGLGLNYINLPWNGPAELNDSVFERSIELLNTAERPILLHCSSANRVAAVWIPWRVIEGGISYEAALAEAKTIGLRIPALEVKAKSFVDRQTK